MNGLVKINNQDLRVKEFNGQKVLTFKDIDRLHERPRGTASRNFNANKYNEDGSERIIENIDYFRVKLTDNEIRSQFEVGNNAKEIILVTESGYLMIVKSLTDDLAWKVQRQLISIYFRVKEFINTDNMKVISLLHAEVGGLIETSSKIESRVGTLEETMTIDYGQQLELSQIAKTVAINAMGDKDKPAYKDSSVRSKVFAQVWKDYREYFDINSYKNTTRVQFERAKEYLKSWKAQGKTLREIESLNGNMAM